MSTRQLFDFITCRDVGIDDNSLNEYITSTRSHLRTETGPMTREELISDQVWMNINLPKTLKDVNTDRLLEDGIYFSALKNLTVSI